MSAGPIPTDVLAAAVAAAREQLRTTGEAEAALLLRLAESAILLGEAFTGAVFVQRTCTEVLACAGNWQPLLSAPVDRVDDVVSLAQDGVPTALPVDHYAVDIDAAGCGWVRLTRGAGRIRVTCRAGLAADWAGLPAPIRQGIAALTAHLFEDREASAQPPVAVAALWRPWRRLQLSAGRGVAR